MMKLNDREWKEFFIKDIVFLKKNDKQLQVPTGSNVSKSRLKKGAIPRITVTSHNNGIDSFYEGSNLTREYENFISVSFLGDAFYHPYKATTDMKVHTFQLARKQLTRYTGLFIITMLKNNTKNSSYGYQLSSTDLPLKKILLPVNSKGEPDYEFMEEYMKEKERKLKNRYKEYIKSNIKELQKRITKNRGWKEWNSFRLDDLFKIISTSSGIDKCKLINVKGNIPYITRTDINNGYSLFIGKQDSKYKIDEDNVVTIGLDTQTVFYQQYQFYTGQNIQILRSDNINKYVALFIIPMIKILMQKFNWGGNGATLTRLKRSRIMLPVNSKGEPDYKYMEDYMRYLEQKKILQYLDYINRTSSD